MILGHAPSSDRIFDAGMQARTSLFGQTDGARRRHIPVPQPDVVKRSDVMQRGPLQALAYPYTSPILLRP